MRASGLRAAACPAHVSGADGYRAGSGAEAANVGNHADLSLQWLTAKRLIVLESENEALLVRSYRLAP